jgi:hypothetical protein
MLLTKPLCTQAAQHHAAAQRAVGASDSATALRELADARTAYAEAGMLAGMAEVP